MYIFIYYKIIHKKYIKYKQFKICGNHKLILFFITFYVDMYFIYRIYYFVMVIR